MISHDGCPTASHVRRFFTRREWVGGEKRGFSHCCWRVCRGKGEGKGRRERSERNRLARCFFLPPFLCEALFYYPLVKERIGWKWEGRWEGGEEQGSRESWVRSMTKVFAESQRDNARRLLPSPYIGRDGGGGGMFCFPSCVCCCELCCLLTFVFVFS